MSSIIIGLGIVSTISIIINVIFVWYARASLSKVDDVIVASENLVEIFSMIDGYKEHLNSVYEMPTFYGDDTLQNLLDHTNQMMAFLKRYEGLYSFTQPDLEEQLLAATIDLEENEEDKKEEE